MFKKLCTLIWGDFSLLFEGNALVKSGEMQKKLTEIKREFVESTTKNYLQPLKAFLENDMKTILVTYITL